MIRALRFVVKPSPVRAKDQIDVDFAEHGFKTLYGQIGVKRNVGVTCAKDCEHSEDRLQTVTDQNTHSSFTSKQSAVQFPGQRAAHPFHSRVSQSLILRDDSDGVRRLPPPTKKAAWNGDFKPAPFGTVAGSTIAGL